MNKGIKYALFFTGGVAVGFGVCGYKVISYAISDEDIRESIENKIVKKIEKLIYGEKQRQNPCRYATSYNPYYNTRHCDERSFQNDKILFEGREEAEAVREEMNDIIDCYGFVTVADLYDLCGISTSYLDNKRGWTNIATAKLVIKSEGYSIKFPTPIQID